VRELFASLPDEQAPPPPPGYLDTVLTVARRSARRRRAVTVAAWAAVLLAIVAVAVPLVRPPSQPASPSTRATLPSRFAGYSVLTADAGGSPAGRAIALYGYGNGELFNMHQPLVVGADRNTYRRIAAMQERELPPALLSPDGTHVLFGDDRSALTDLQLLDLTTGRQRPVPVGEAVGVRLLAWSPDGRYVAYGAAPVPENTDNIGNFVDAEVARTGTLRILDLTTFASTPLPLATPVWTAAFAFDSRRIAVQVGQRLHLLDVSGAPTAAPIDLPADRQLVGNVGWSLGGDAIATMPLPVDGQANGNTGHDTYLTERQTLTFVRAPGARAVPPPDLDAVQLLGWTSRSQVLVLDADAVGHLTIALVDLRDGSRRVLSRFDTGSTCEFGTQSCQVFDLQLATGLLPGVTVRDAGWAHRGPWPAWFALTVTVPAVSVAVLAWWLIRRRTRRLPTSTSPVGT
jgi:dipeptidyl aminopeptidase/acylaminoacyl peptidase